MSPARLRLALVALNVALVASAGLLIHDVYAGERDWPRVSPVDPVRYAVSPGAAGGGGLARHAVVWANLDRPLPDPPPAPAEEAAPAAPRASLGELIVVWVDPARPERSTATVRVGDRQLTLGVGDDHAGGQVVAIAVEGDAETCRGVVELVRSGVRERLELRREREPGGA